MIALRGPTGASLFAVFIATSSLCASAARRRERWHSDGLAFRPLRLAAAPDRWCVVTHRHRVQRDGERADCHQESREFRAHDLRYEWIQDAGADRAGEGVIPERPPE